jgi:hypothetical protein
MNPASFMEGGPRQFLPPFFDKSGGELGMHDDFLVQSLVQPLQHLSMHAPPGSMPPPMGLHIHPHMAGHPSQLQHPVRQLVFFFLLLLLFLFLFG